MRGVQSTDADSLKSPSFVSSNGGVYKELPQRWLHKKANLAWKLLVLVVLGLCGIYMCMIGVEQRICCQKSSSDLTASKDIMFDVCLKTKILSSGARVHHPQPFTYDRKECTCTPVHYFVIFSMQRSGSGWFETLLNNHPNISSHGEVFSVEERRANFSIIRYTLDTIYNLDWSSSAAKNDCTAAVGLKWMLNQGAMEYRREVVSYFMERSVSVIFLFRRNILKRYVSILANNFDRDAKLLNGTHQSHVHSKKEADLLAAFKPSVNVTFLPAYLQRVHEIMNDALSYFNSTRHIILYYEDLIKDPKRLYSIQEFLGLQPRKLESHHVKIHTRPLSRHIQNWNEVLQRLKGSKFESFLSDVDYN